jgi:hypothetical protein
MCVYLYLSTNLISALASLDMYDFSHFATFPVQVTNISEHYKPTDLNWFPLGSLHGYLELLS